MPHVTEQDLKDQLAELIDAVANGEEITISRDGQPIAKLTPFTPVNKRTLGFFPINFVNDFSAPTDQDIIDEFYKD
jgi:prevent-host-death family protein